MEYYLGTISYKDGKGSTHHNTVLLKAINIDSAKNGLKKDFLDKGMLKDNFIKVEIHNTILCK